MAGVKGRSGRRPEPRPDIDGSDPEEFLRSVVADLSAPLRTRLDAAKALLPHISKVQGKKGDKEEAAKLLASHGKFSAPTQPKLDIRKLN